MVLSAVNSDFVSIATCQTSSSWPACWPRRLATNDDIRPMQMSFTESRRRFVFVHNKSIVMSQSDARYFRPRAFHLHGQCATVSSLRTRQVRRSQRDDESKNSHTATHHATHTAHINIELDILIQSRLNLCTHSTEWVCLLKMNTLELVALLQVCSDIIIIT